MNPCNHRDPDQLTHRVPGPTASCTLQIYPRGLRYLPTVAHATNGVHVNSRPCTLLSRTCLLLVRMVPTVHFVITRTPTLGYGSTELWIFLWFLFIQR